MTSPLLQRVFTIVFFVTLSVMLFGLVAAAFGIDSGLFEPLAVLMTIGLAALFGGGFIAALVGPFREGLSILCQGGENRVERFAIWCSHNMELEEAPLASPDVIPSRPAKIAGVSIFIVYFGFVWTIVAYIGWRLVAWLT